MTKFRAIFSRELRGYFDSPIAYIFLIVFLFVNCGLFMSSFFLVARSEMRYFFDILPMILVVFIPAITMRLWAEDKKQGTIELILTFPMPTYQIVLGKFFAAFLFYSIALLSTCTIPTMLMLLGNPDMGQIIGGYIGSLLLGGFFLSIGLFISGFSRDQIVAFIIGTVICFGFYLTGTFYISAQLDGWTGVLALGTKLQNYVGVTRHLQGIQRGVIHIKNIFYFIGMITFFLTLNTWFLDTRMRQKGKTKAAVAGLIVFCVVIFAMVVVSRMEGGQIDLTEDKIFTMSSSARNVLASLKAPVKVKLFITPAEKMPSEMKNLERDIKDYLEEYKNTSKNKLTYEIYNPTGEGALEEKLLKLGIRPMQVQSIERDEVGVKIIFSALSISYLDKKEEIIPAVVPMNIGSLEYELISRIYKIASAKKPKIAIYAPPEQIDPNIGQYYMKMGRQIPEPKKLFTSVSRLLQEEDYTTVDIGLNKNEPVPEDTDTLLVFRPINLNDRQKYEINKFILKGGNVIFAIQNHEYAYYPMGNQGMQITPSKLNPEINSLISGYGVTINEGMLMDENLEVLSIPTEQNLFGLFKGVVNTPVKMPVQMKILSENMSRDVSISNRISSLLYLWGSALTLDSELIEKNGIKAKILAKTSKRSWILPYNDRPLTKIDIQPDEFEKDGAPIAVLLEGKFADIYKGKEIPPWPSESGEQDENKKSEKKPQDNIESKSSRIVIVGCAKMFDDDMLPAASNAVLLLNSVDALSRGEDLINLRSKTQINRLIPRVSATVKLWSRFFVIFFVPILIGVLGVIRFMIRKREKENYLQSLSS